MKHLYSEEKDYYGHFFTKKIESPWIENVFLLSKSVQTSSNIQIKKIWMHVIFDKILECRPLLYWLIFYMQGTNLLSFTNLKSLKEGFRKLVSQITLWNYPDLGTPSFSSKSRVFEVWEMDSPFSYLHWTRIKLVFESIELSWRISMVF